ncbi:MAG: electron transfer flavoprotein subunit beta/FixA family protein [Nitrospinota bacterium]
MDIIVCIKQVQDPDIPPRDFKVDEEKLAVIPPLNVPPVISTFDENAIEAAVQLKEGHGANVTALTVGPDRAKGPLKKCLAMGCDEAILLQDEAFEGSDAFGVARILAAAVRKIGAFDIILCGRLSSDWSYGATGPALAEALDLLSVSQVQKIEAMDGGLRCERVIEDGFEVVEVSTPCLLTVSNELNRPRLPTAKGILAATRKQIPVWSAGDVGVDPVEVGAGAARLELTKLYKPVFAGGCEFIQGETLGEKAENLALRLREDKIL